MIGFLTFLFSLAYSTEFLLLITISTVLLFGLVLPLIYCYLQLKFKRLKKSQKNETNQKEIVAFFHPYCNAGGGGEKVLWVAVQSLIKTYGSNAKFYIYTGDMEFTPSEILAKVSQNLNVEIDPKDINFIYLNCRKWIEPQNYPYFTLLGQSLGSIFMAFKALNQLVPDILIETTGCTFVLPLFKYLAHAKTGSYVHYPIITQEMIKRVQMRKQIYNNRSLITRNPLFSYGKLIYYKFFASIYSLAGKCSDVTLVNSTFTLNHLTMLWGNNLHLVYPPCDIDHLISMDRTAKSDSGDIRIVSLAQFRPEKDHPLQLQALYELRELIGDHFERVKLVLIGSCRNQNDEERVKDLRDLTKHLSLENNVEFKVNLSYAQLLDELALGLIGIHTMLDEHFGISVVELMAAGLIVVAHKSGGPLLDIVETSVEESRLGFLAYTAQDYAEIIRWIIRQSGKLNGREESDELREIRERARASVERFSREKFEIEFRRGIKPLFL